MEHQEPGPARDLCGLPCGRALWRRSNRARRESRPDRGRSSPAEFRVSSALDNLPAHWDEKYEKAGALGPSGRSADFPARAWAIGRLMEQRQRSDFSSDDWRKQRLAPSRWPGTIRCAETGGTLAGVHRIWLLFVPSRPARPGLAAGVSSKDGVAVGSPRWGTWILPATNELIENSPPAVAGWLSPDARAARDRHGEAGRACGDRLGLREATRVAREVSNAGGTRSMSRRSTADRADRQPQAWDQVKSWDEAAGRYLRRAAVSVMAG